MKNANEPASPCTVECNVPISGTDDGYGNEIMSDGLIDYKGLTKREMFAMHAMQGLVISDRFSNEQDAVEVMAKWSVQCADALLKELENDNPTVTQKALVKRDRNI